MILTVDFVIQERTCDADSYSLYRLDGSLDGVYPQGVPLEVFPIGTGYWCLLPKIGPSSTKLLVRSSHS